MMNAHSHTAEAAMVDMLELQGRMAEIVCREPIVMSGQVLDFKRQ